MSTTILETSVRPVEQRSTTPVQRTKKPSLYHVVLLDDDDHTYDYVIGMVRKLFGWEYDRAFSTAYEVDESGRVILDTTTLERAELKRDQIRTFGRDWRIPRCEGSMSAVIEPAEVPA